MANDVILLDQRQRDDQGGYGQGGYGQGGSYNQAGSSNRSAPPGAPDNDLEDLPF
jgi:hypothetical protein